MRKRQRALWFLAASLLVAFAAAFLLLLAAGGSFEPLPAPESQRAAVLGLAALVLLFVVYGMTQQRRLAGLEDDLQEIEVRERTMRARFEELEALFGAGLSPADRSAALQIAAERLRRGLDADACAIWVVEPGAASLQPRAASGAGDPAAVLHHVAHGEGMTGRVHASGASMVVEAGPLLGELAVEMNLPRTPGSALCVPLRAGEASLGVISAIRFDPGSPFGPEHARLLESLATRISRAIHPVPDPAHAA